MGLRLSLNVCKEKVRKCIMGERSRLGSSHGKPSPHEGGGKVLQTYPLDHLDKINDDICSDPRETQCSVLEHYTGHLTQDQMDLDSGDTDVDELSKSLDMPLNMTPVEHELRCASSGPNAVYAGLDTATSDQCSPRSLDSEDIIDDMDLSQDLTFPAAHRPSHPDTQSDTREEALEMEREQVLHNWQLVRSMSVPEAGWPPQMIPAGRAHASFLLRD